MGNEVKWTDEQKSAIYEKGENILVAAAAGSGKTAVLVERIIQKILNDNVDIDKLLVVTFTNAAASEMRERVLEAIYKKLDEDPDNENLQRQIVLLGKSNICTIHSFGLDVIRNYFYEIDLPANFRIGSEEEVELLRQETLEDIFEDLYESNDKNFSKLVEVYTNYKGDEDLRELILRIYKYIQSSPFPKEWLHEKIEMFNCKNVENKDFSETEWGKILLEELRDELYDAICNLQIIEKKIVLYNELEKFTLTIQKDIEKLKSFYELTNKGWDSAYEYSTNFKFDTWPRDSKVTLDLKEKSKEVRDTVKDKIKDVIKKIMVCPSIEAFEDIYAMYDILTYLEEVILKFDSEFKKRKKDKNLIDFNDIEHFALQILVKKDETGNAVPTDIAKQYQDKFVEIAIDEYQDSNQVQEYILSTISNGNNVFMVGDVKQSIYKFRQACPDLFLQKYSTYTKQKSGKGLKIQLFKNFRSRSNILDFTNIIFENIMSKSLGDLDYTEEEYLNLGASYPEAENSYSEQKNATTEMLLIDMKDEEEELDIWKDGENSAEKSFDQDEEDDDEEDAYKLVEKEELEAKLVCKKIQEIIKSKINIFDKKKGLRPVEYRDIVILLRSTSKLAQIYEKELIKNNIPVYSDANSEFLETYEIQTIMNTLKILDNPMDDISLVSVLRSEIGSFTDNDLIEIRLENRESSFYQSLIDASVKLNGKLQEKIKLFLARLDSWKNKSKYMNLAELIWKIYTDTGFYNYVSLMPNGALRQGNLKKLFERAKDYESTSFKGLFNFLRFMEKIRIGSGDLSPAKMIGENENVVRIMSIHKSKGLEFPIVFLSSTGKRINLMDLNTNLLLHQNLGLGPEYINYERRIEYSTAAKRAIQIVSKRETISEEMRVLYVALTRAKEKLIITGIGKDIEKELLKKEELLEIYHSNDGKINPILLKKYITYEDWIELIYKKGNLAGKIELKIISKKELMEEKENENVEIPKFPFDTNFDEKQIEEKLNYKYAHLLSTKLPLKSTVSKIKEMQNEAENEEIFDLETNLVNDQYMFELPSTIASSLAKNTFSNLKNNKEENLDEISNEKFVIKNKLDFETQKPKFMQETEKITNAEKGTLTHFILQKIDFKKDYSKEDLENFIYSFVANNTITTLQAESINRNSILKFLNSELALNLREAKIIEREKTFCTKIKAKEVFKDIENIDSEDYILVQGIIDLFYQGKDGKWVLVDYKTDYVQQGEENILVSKYKKQLEIYKKALEDEICEKVSKVCIYSLFLNKKIEI
jgi:ATP-dependent helicase/nuclease subunit A